MFSDKEEDQDKDKDEFVSLTVIFKSFSFLSALLTVPPNPKEHAEKSQFNWSGVVCYVQAERISVVNWTGYS